MTPVGGPGQLELRRPTPDLVDGLAAFFEHLERTGESLHFHPHPFDRATAQERCAYSGADVYCVATVGGRVLGYGMLRGWDAGYAVPSLGIALRQESRGTGLARTIMLYLHTQARLMGAQRIRLKVYPDNARAVGLYRTLGYEFGETLEQGQLVGTLQLGCPRG
jgi:[ribosomal protein S18]-alanine N-acetyltransferase